MPFLSLSLPNIYLIAALWIGLALLASLMMSQPIILVGAFDDNRPNWYYRSRWRVPAATYKSGHDVH